MTNPALHVAPELPAYPDDYPLPDRAPYAIAVDMGLVRSDMGTGTTQQRRLFRNMPQRFSLVFHMRVERLQYWQHWVNDTAYDWFTMPLGSMYAGAQQLSPHITRFLSNVISIEMDGHDWLRVTVAAEIAPDMFASVPPAFDITADTIEITADSTLYTADNYA